MATERLNSPGTDAPIVSLGTNNGIDIAIVPRADKILGRVILKPDSPDLIERVQIESLAVHPDDRE